ILARHGGDEFVLLLPATSVQGADSVLDRLRDERLAVRWSIGICEWLPQESLDKCLTRADAHLYSAKSSVRASDNRATVALSLGSV
ncbi:MAG TPA: diguanylate cyclase, partial [Solirubrobacteraceae bacterium]|nr:diguanylate cyclase [Solirubrobacteraceae bacterium]